MFARNIALFVPLHDEEEKVGDVLTRTIDAIGHRLSLLVVADDGSTDRSREIARKYTRHVVRHQRNLGNGAITRSALQYVAEADVRWDAVIRIDGDGQHDPALLPEIVDRLDRSADYVMCSRFHPASDVRHAPIDRLILNSAMATGVRLITGWPVTDARSGFFGIRRELVLPVIGDLRTRRYGIPIELLLRVWDAFPNARYEEIPHPALYQPGISRRLDDKYREEEVDAKIARMLEAYRVLLETGASLRHSGEIDRPYARAA